MKEAYFVLQKKARTDDLQDGKVAQPGPLPSEPISTPAQLPEAEVKRRLRRLGQPVTLFGEDAEVRSARLAHAEATLLVHDEDAGGGERANVLLDIRREDRERAKRSRNGECSTSCAGQQQGEAEGPPRPAPVQHSTDGEKMTETVSLLAASCCCKARGLHSFVRCFDSCNSTKGKLISSAARFGPSSVAEL
jgi:hypothetical protein